MQRGTIYYGVIGKDWCYLNFAKVYRSSTYPKLKALSHIYVTDNIYHISGDCSRIWKYSYTLDRVEKLLYALHMIIPYIIGLWCTKFQWSESKSCLPQETGLTKTLVHSRSQYGHESVTKT